MAAAPQPRSSRFRSCDHTNHTEHPGLEARFAAEARTSRNDAKVCRLENILRQVAIARATREGPSPALGVQTLQFAFQCGAFRHHGPRLDRCHAGDECRRAARHMTPVLNRRDSPPAPSPIAGERPPISASAPSPAARRRRTSVPSLSPRAARSRSGKDGREARRARKPA